MVVWLVFVIGTSVATANPDADEGTGQSLENSRRESGRSVYNFHCYFCHGYSGDARTLASGFLSPPPRDFTKTDPAVLHRSEMLRAVREGRPGTAMQPFEQVLTMEEIVAVVDFVRQEFMLERRVNTRYHTAENGWEDHERFAIAFPFVRSEIALDAPAASLDTRQRAGRALYLRSCVSCHDRAGAEGERVVWEPRALSYPRLGFRPGDAGRISDAVTGASPYARHDIAPVVSDLSADERRGEHLFQINCAFCHAADGTGRNWIGTFLQPSPRDLTDPEYMGAMTRERLGEVISRGLPGTSMPAWGSVLTEEDIQAIVAYVHRVLHPLAN